MNSPHHSKVGTIGLTVNAYTTIFIQIRAPVAETDPSLPVISFHP